MLPTSTTLRGRGSNAPSAAAPAVIADTSGVYGAEPPMDLPYGEPGFGGYGDGSIGASPSHAALGASRGGFGGGGGMGYNNEPMMFKAHQSRDFMDYMWLLGAGMSAFGVVVAWIALPWLACFLVTGVLCVCVFGFWFAKYLSDSIMEQPRGDQSMRAIAGAILEGAEGYLRTQYGTIARFAGVLTVLLFGVYLLRPNPPAGSAGHTFSALSVAVCTGLSFLAGCVCSALAGNMGVWMAVRANLRVAAAAARHASADALMLAFRGGAVAAVMSAALCISGITVLFAVLFGVFRMATDVHESDVPLLLVGYGFGASFVALFMQLGGGIYTKAADVGADLVGKVESGIPEDDPRNPAVIADLVGDNVGDCAGSMADVFESIAAEVIGTMLLGGVMARQAGLSDASPFIFFALVIHSLDVVVSAVGIMFVRGKLLSQNPMTALKRGYYLTSGLAIVGYVLCCKMMLDAPEAPGAWLHFAGCGMIGIAMANCLILITQYYTDYEYSQVQGVAEASTTGHATNVIAGIAVGLESTGLPAVVIGMSLLGCYVLGSTSGIASHNAGLFGTACGTMGMLCTAVYVLSTNNFGPISDNAGGIVEMSHQPEEIRAITDHLDAVGNVTKAATKGYAVGGSALATFVLFRAFLDEMGELRGVPFESVNIALVEVLVAGLLGVMMVFVFSAWAIKAVGISAQEVIREVRRQFREIPGIMDGSARPEYGRCVSIVTQSALRQMVKPAVLALGTPVAVALFFRLFAVVTGRENLAAEALASFLIFGAITGLMMATFFDNSGGAWDNAKKWIEAGAHGGSGSEAHKSSVTGDTVGDPFKDTAGPSLHVIITTMSTTALILGPLIL